MALVIIAQLGLIHEPLVHGTLIRGRIGRKIEKLGQVRRVGHLVDPLCGGRRRVDRTLRDVVGFAGTGRFQVIGATVWTSLAHVVGGLGCGCQAPGLVCRAAQGLVSRAVICHSRAGRAIGFVGDLCRVGGVAPGVSESRASLRSVPSGRPCGAPLTPPHQALGGR
jgi:hypothetical protein